MQTILKRSREWFTAPVFPGDKDKTRNAQVLYVLLANILALLVLGMLAVIFVVGQKISVSMMLFTLLILALVSHALVQRGRVLAASRLFVVGAWILFTLHVLLIGRMNTALVSFQLAVTVMAGVLLGRRPAIILSLLSICVGLGLALLESADYPLVSYLPVSPLAGWAAWVLAFILILTLLNPAVQRVARSAGALCASETRFRSVYSQSPIAIELYDAQGLLVDANPACLDLFGVTDVKAVKGFKLLEDPNMPEAAKRQLLAGEAVHYQTAFDFDLVRDRDLYETTKSGLRYLDCFITPWSAEKGAPNGFLVHIRDITERVQAEKELNVALVKYKTLFEAFPLGVTVSDEEGNVIETSRVAENLLGISTEEHLSRDIDGPEWQIIRPDGTPMPVDEYASVRALKENRLVENVEMGILKSPGETTWINVAAAPIPLEGYGVVIVYGDITERVQAVNALRRHRVLLNETGKMAKVGGWEIDLASQTLTWTDEVYRIHEVGADFQPTVATAIDFYAPESKPVIERAVQVAIERGVPFDVELQIITAKGNRRWVHAFGQKKNDVVFGAVQDITERKQMELALRESEERLEFALEGSQLGYWDWDIGTGRVQRNARWAEMLGYTLQEIEFDVKQWTDLHHPDDTDLAWQSIHDHLEGRSSEHKVEYRMRAKDGQYRWILDQAKIVKRDPQGKPLRMSGTHTDITERKQAENIVQARLRVNEFAREHALEKLLQNALDEMCALTDSPIGFFHFVEPDQRTLSLQAWSTRTLEEMCAAGGKEQHDDIDLAGVWVDCVRQGAPVIHNDYASLPHRKGLPEGHAPIVREMVFPILRNQKIVAIIGVGNKAQEYTRDDLAHASRLADILWDITERKRAEEREREQRALAEALSDTAAALNGTLDPNEVLDRVLDNVGRVVPHDAANIMLLDKDGDTLSLMCHRGYLERGAKKEEIERRISLAAIPILAEATRSGQPSLVHDTHTNPVWVDLPATQWIRSNLTMPVQIFQTTVGFLNLASETTGFFNHEHSERLRAFANHAAIAIQNAQLYENMKTLAITDALTGVYNRAFFETELARADLGRDFPVSIIVADLDNLKTTNDLLGHMAGDELIKNVARILKETFRASDIIARIGGDEFAILLPNTNAATVEQMLSRVREKLAKHNAAHPHLPVLVSLGASTAKQDELMKAFTAADQHMYADKIMRKSKGN